MDRKTYFNKIPKRNVGASLKASEAEIRRAIPAIGVSSVPLVPASSPTEHRRSFEKSNARHASSFSTCANVAI